MPLSLAIRYYDTIRFLEWGPSNLSEESFDHVHKTESDSFTNQLTWFLHNTLEMKMIKYFCFPQNVVSWDSEYKADIILDTFTLIAACRTFFKNTQKHMEFDWRVGTWMIDFSFLAKLIPHKSSPSCLCRFRRSSNRQREKGYHIVVIARTHAGEKTREYVVWQGVLWPWCDPAGRV